MFYIRHLVKLRNPGQRATKSGPTAPVAVLREFHDRLAESGSLPLGLAERAVLDAR